MSHELPGLYIDPDEQSNGFTPLFFTGFSDDAIYPRFRYPQSIARPDFEDGEAIYDMNKQYISRDRERVAVHIPTIHPVNNYTVYTAGCAGFDLSIDRETKDILDYKLTFRPMSNLDESISSLVILSKAFQEQFSIDEHLGEIVNKLAPECKINSEEGISLFTAGNKLIDVSFGGGTPHVEYSQQFWEQVDQGLAFPFDFSEQVLQSEYTVVSFSTPKDEFVMTSGLIIYDQSFPKITDLGRNILQGKVQPQELEKYVEPYFLIGIRSNDENTR